MGFQSINKGLYRDLRKKTAILCKIGEIVTKLIGKGNTELSRASVFPYAPYYVAIQARGGILNEKSKIGRSNNESLRVDEYHQHFFTLDSGL